MLCPNCNAGAKRSRPRSLRERLMKAFTGYKIYSCQACGWRALCAPTKGPDSSVTRHVILGWVAAVLLAAAIVAYVINDFYTKSGTPAAGRRVK